MGDIGADVEEIEIVPITIPAPEPQPVPVPALNGYDFSADTATLSFDVLPLRGWRGWRMYVPGDGLLWPVARVGAPAWENGWDTAQHDTLSAVRCRCDLCRQSGLDPFCRGVGSPACVCGFYAYTDPDADDGLWRTVRGIVEGAGRCSWGSKGFRAEKAHVVALTRDAPPNGGRWGVGFLSAVHERAAHIYRVPLFDTLTEAVEAFPLTPKHRPAGA